MKKKKPAFKPVMTRRVAIADDAAFGAALAASDRLTIIETRTTITFRFRKRGRNQ